MKALSDINLAFVCMNQPYTMTLESAAEAVNAFKPKMVCPYHYRNADKSLSDIKKFSEMVEMNGISCVLLDWYPN